VARSIRLVTISLLMVLVLSGCRTTGPEWVDAGATYSAADVKGIFAQVESGPAQDAPVSDATEMRHAALVGLRRHGGAATQAADLITRTFPATAGVPLYVERAVFEEATDALVLVELIGPEGGKLGDMRLWVLDASGDILFSAVR